MSFLLEDCTFLDLTEELIDECEDFSCEKNKDIEQFFKSEFINYSLQLLGKSYCFIREGENKEIVCAFTVANSSIRVYDLPKSRRNKINRGIPNKKRRSQYPAVLIGQLAVFDGFHRQGIGTELMDFIKSWIIEPSYRTGCRYLIVDAVNNPKVLKYYENNGFSPLFSSDEEEMEYFVNMVDEVDSGRRTRLMFFDLIKLFSEA